MAISFRCPKCRGRYRAPNELAGKTTRCKCGVLVSIPAIPQTASSQELPGPQSSPIQSTCPGCRKTRVVPEHMVGKKIRCPCGTVIQIGEATSPAPASGSPVSRNPASPTAAPSEPKSTDSLFDELTDDDWSTGATLEPAETALPRLSDSEVLTQYTKSGSSLTSTNTSSRYKGFFGPEKRGLDYGMAGGMLMMLIAAVWFVAGLACGYIFYYPPVLFAIGLFGFLRGLLSGHILG